MAGEALVIGQLGAIAVKLVVLLVTVPAQGGVGNNIRRQLDCLDALATAVRST